MHVYDFCISDIWVVVNFSVMDSIVIDGKPCIHHTAVSVKPVEQEFVFLIAFTILPQICSPVTNWCCEVKLQEMIVVFLLENMLPYITNFSIRFYNCCFQLLNLERM